MARRMPIGRRLWMPGGSFLARIEGLHLARIEAEHFAGCEGAARPLRGLGFILRLSQKSRSTLEM